MIVFGVRYFVSRFDTVEKPYERMSYDGKYHAFENEYALPMAYIAPSGLKDFDISGGNTFEKQNRIASYWTDGPIFIKAEPEIKLEGVVEPVQGHYERTGDEGYVVYNITVTEELPLYFYFYAPHRQNAEVFVNNEPYDVYFTVNHWNTLCAGSYSPGDEIEIRMKLTDESIDIDEACFYYENPEAIKEWKKAADELDRTIGEVNEITSSHLMFETKSTEPVTVMMSIPYESSWKITCDDKELTPAPAMDVLMSFDVPEGEHVIEMKYTPEGTGIGIMASAAGIILFAVLIFCYRKKQGK